MYIVFIDKDNNQLLNKLGTLINSIIRSSVMRSQILGMLNNLFDYSSRSVTFNLFHDEETADLYQFLPGEKKSAELI